MFAFHFVEVVIEQPLNNSVTGSTHGDQGGSQQTHSKVGARDAAAEQGGVLDAP